MGHWHGLHDRVDAGPPGKLRRVARYLYHPSSIPPTPEEAARYGLTVEEASGPPFEVWPDNWQTVGVFLAMDTQWRYGPNGPTGLDYGVLPTVLQDFLDIKRTEWSDVFRDLRVMENAALQQMRSKK